MKHKIKEAVEAKDVVRVRTLLIEMMAQRAGRTDTLLEISETISAMPEVFVADDGKKYPDAHTITDEGLSRLEEDLRDNFSLPKYRLFTEVHARIRRDPDFKLTDKAATLENVLSTALPDSAAPAEAPRKPLPKAKLVGYIVMALGLVASIVGICVPVGFLIGLGIGILMLGSAIVYMAIPRT